MSFCNYCGDRGPTFQHCKSELEARSKCGIKVNPTAYHERLRAIENAKGMPEELVDIIKAVTEQSCVNGCGSMKHCICSYAEDLVDDNRKVRLHAQHLQDRLNRMEALLREPTPEMIDVGFDAAGKQYSPDPTDDGLELTFAVWKAMSAVALDEKGGSDESN